MFYPLGKNSEKPCGGEGGRWHPPPPTPCTSEGQFKNSYFGFHIILGAMSDIYERDVESSFMLSIKRLILHGASMMESSG